MKTQVPAQSFGRFRSSALIILFSAVISSAIGQTQVAPPSPGQEDDEVVELETYEVRAIYANQQMQAREAQRASDRVSNIIAADTIGLLPDENLRMALNRLPGVNVAGGDSGQVSIRGMEGKLNSITLNGNAMPAAAVTVGGFGSQGDDRGIDLMKIPASAIQGLEVIKTPTSDLDGDFIGGRIDLKTKSAFDFDKRISYISAEYKTYEFGGDGYSTDFGYGDKLNAAGTLGLYLNGTWMDYSREFGQTNIDSANPEGSLVGDPNIVEAIDPNQQLEDVEQLSLNGTLDWRASDNSTWSFSAWYNGQKKVDDRPRVQVQYRDTDEDLLDPSGLVASGEGRIRIRKRGRIRPDRDYQQLRLGIENETRFGDSVLDSGFIWGQSTFTAHEYEYRFQAQFSDVLWTIDRSRSPILPEYSFTPPAGVDMFNDPSPYEATDISWEQVDNSDDTMVLYADLTTDLQTERPIKLKAGFKGTMKDAENRGNIRYYSGTDDLTFQTIGIRNEPFSAYNMFEDFGFTADGPSFGRWLEANKDNAQYLDEDFGAGAEETVADLLSNVQEDIWAGYLMATVDIESFRLIGGLRYEYTDATYGWPASLGSRDSLTFPDEQNDVSYGKWIPSVIGVYRFSWNDVLRVAWSRPIARPDWSSLIPIDTGVTLAVIDPDELISDTVIDVEVNNPDMDPQQSDNFDLAYEHYYGESNLISLGYFYKKMNNYIGAPIPRMTDQQATNKLTGEPLFTESGEPVYYRVSRPENGVEQTVHGLEFVWNHRFAELPSLLSGLGVNFNFTYIDGQRRAPLFEDPANPYEITGYKEYDQIENQPEKIFHVTVFWEYEGFSARVGYVRNGSQVSVFDDFDPGVHYVRAQLESLDATISYEFKNGWKVYAEANNLTGEPEDARYALTEDYYQTYDLNGKSYAVGVRWAF